MNTTTQWDTHNEEYTELFLKLAQSLMEDPRFIGPENECTLMAICARLVEKYATVLTLPDMSEVVQNLSNHATSVATAELLIN